MQFVHVYMALAAILAVPLLLMFYGMAERLRKNKIERFGGAVSPEKIVVHHNETMRRALIGLNIGIIVCILIALARPQWDFYWKENRAKGLDIIIGIDVSKSMLAADVSPTRLQFAKSGIRAFVKGLKDDRVGIMAFSGSAFLECPLTVDYKSLAIVLDALDTRSIGRGGTSLSRAIIETIRSYEGAETPNKILILVSDGEHMEGDLGAAIDRAREASVKIYCIGVGTDKGATIELEKSDGEKELLKDDRGRPVVSRIQEDMMRHVAEATGGVYIRAESNNFGLEKLYADHLSKLEKHEYKGDKVKVYQDKFQVPLACACVLLLISIGLAAIGKDDEA